MKNKKISWKFRWLPYGTPKKIAWKGLKITIVSIIISTLADSFQFSNTFLAILGALFQKVFTIMAGYGDLLILAALVKYIVFKFNKKEKSLQNNYEK